MPLAYFDLDDLKAAFESVALLGFLCGLVGYVGGAVFHALMGLLVVLLRRRGAAAPFDERVRAAQRRHVLVARMLQARINREDARLASIPSVGSESKS
jgi:hypothetical protein